MGEAVAVNLSRSWLRRRVAERRAGLRELTAGSGLSSAQSADWSSDGTRIVFLGSPGQDEGAALYVIDADGADLTRLTPLDPEWGCCREPDW